MRPLSHFFLAIEKCLIRKTWFGLKMNPQVMLTTTESKPNLFCGKWARWNRIMEWIKSLNQACDSAQTSLERLGFAEISSDHRIEFSEIFMDVKTKLSRGVFRTRMIFFSASFGERAPRESWVFLNWTRWLMEPSQLPSWL